MVDKVPKTRVSPSMDEPLQDEHDESTKRPPNAYMLFCMRTREKLLQREPELTYKSVMNRLGELWKNMTKEETQPYKDEAKRLQAEFKAKYPNYKYKPRKPKTTHQSTNHMTLPAGISNAEASYLMLLGAQTLLNQKGTQQPTIPNNSGQPGQPVQPIQMSQLNQVANAINEVSDKKMETVNLPFTTGEMPVPLANISQLQPFQNAPNNIGHVQNYPWNPPKQ
ncbi:Protein SOX-15 [Tritrichomonas musculus]|uniref:Protein SOX-15 n=1 Tax=Tritrichomonas musculus TaxID=1915356 RepID=A0ABR2K7G1_9EUKA